ncbi:MAG: flagellar motor switch protein FliN [Thermaerobacter sp.]|nr:flagellar motor switch protein FliN [Thermaerobacter sp.]
MSKRANKLTAEDLAALVEEEAPEAGVPVRPVEFAELDAGPRTPARGSAAALGFILDVPLEVQVVLGSTRLPVRQVLELGPGAVVELDKAYADPVDVYLNGRLVAHGEVVVAGENFGVKITEIFSEALDGE